MFATDRRAQLDGALADIAGSAWLHDSADDLMAVVGRELDDIYSGIDAVRDQIRLTDESVKLLVRQHTDMQFRTMSRQLAALFTTLSGRAAAKDHAKYGIGLSTATMPTLATRARETPVKTTAPALQTHTDADASALDLHGIVAAGGPASPTWSPSSPSIRSCAKARSTWRPVSTGYPGLSAVRARSWAF